MSTVPDDVLAPPLAAMMADVLPMVLARHGEALALKDVRSGRYAHVDSALEALIGRPGMVGRSDADLFEPELAAAMRLADQKALAQGEAVPSEHRMEVTGGRHEIAVLRLASRADSEGQRWIVSVWSDVTAQRQRDQQLRLALEQIEQQQRANEQLRREIADQGLRDPATGLYTRAHFEDQLRREVDLSTREHREFAVVFIELDPPDDKARALGEPARARILEAVGRLLRGGTRAMDASCRFDDRRFAVLLSGVGLATAHSRMEGVRRQCATQIVVLDGQEMGFSVSMGVASFPHTAHSQDNLLEACASALAEAQRRGGNHVTLAAIKFDSGA